MPTPAPMTIACFDEAANAKGDATISCIKTLGYDNW